MPLSIFLVTHVDLLVSQINSTCDDGSTIDMPFSRACSQAVHFISSSNAGSRSAKSECSKLRIFTYSNFFHRNTFISTFTGRLISDFFVC